MLVAKGLKTGDRVPGHGFRNRWRIIEHRGTADVGLPARRPARTGIVGPGDLGV